MPAAPVDALVLGALVLDDIPILSKVLGFLALTLLLPIAVPHSLVLRRRRHARTQFAAMA